MAQITSRKQMERWLKDKPIEWAQVIAARAALRVLPYAFTLRTDDMWIEAYSHNMFYANMILWIAFDLPNHNIDDAVTIHARIFNDAADAAHGRGAADAANAAREAIRALDDVVNANGAASAMNYSAEAVADAAYADAFELDGSAYSDHHAAAEVARAVAWSNLSHDCDRLENGMSIEMLSRERLWPVGTPVGWDKIWALGAQRLASSPFPNSQNFSVWIDWYNRRIERHEAAFDIPGDKNRIEDKKILARLADASNEDFWNKGPTYVNTTLQNWIDEARERVAPKETPTQEIDALTYGVNADGKLYRLPAMDQQHLHDAPDQQRIYRDVREAALELQGEGQRLGARLEKALGRFIGSLPDNFADAECYSIWRHGNTLRRIHRAHRVVEGNTAYDDKRLDPAIAIMLDEVLNLYNQLVIGDPRLREMDAAAIPLMERGINEERESVKPRKITDPSRQRDPVPEPIPQQNQNAIPFTASESGKIRIDQSRNADALRIDADAQDRHSEAIREARALLKRCRLSNSAARFVSGFENYLSAGGDTLADLRPSLFVQRGEKLRQEIAAYEGSEQDSFLEPIADDLLIDLKGWRSAHNMAVGLDPVLMRIDTAMLGPDVKSTLIAPSELHAFVADADEADILDDGVREIVDEAIDLAPDVPDPNDRRTVWSVESVQNLVIEAFSVALNHPGKALAGGAVAAVVLPKVTVFGAVATGVTGFLPAAKFLIKHRTWIETRLNNTPTWQSLFNQVCDRLEEWTPFKSSKDDDGV